MKLSLMKKLALSTSALVAIYTPAAMSQAQVGHGGTPAFACVQAQAHECNVTAVSYTHLTLPTKA